jgi:hypothetical protein
MFWAVGSLVKCCVARGYVDFSDVTHGDGVRLGAFNISYRSVTEAECDRPQVLFKFI